MENLDPFIAITGSTKEQAEFYLGLAKGDLQKATDLYFEHAQDAKPRIQTFSSMNSNSADTQGPTYFAGGEKSGVLMQGPPKDQGEPTDLVKEILEMAAKSGPPPEDFQEQSKPRFFAGSGHRLGDESTSSAAGPSVAAPRAVSPSEGPIVSRSLTFWADGFSIDDGPLQDYKDPQNQEFLEAIKQGMAPMKYLNVKPGERVEVKVAHRMQEPYQPPPKKPMAAFSGHGNRLGAIVPGETPSVSAPQVTQAPPKAPPSSWKVDESAPTTSIQVRLADGTRLVVKCNHTHTLSDIVSFIRASRPGESARNFILQTSHPVVKLERLEQTVKEAGLLNSVIVQRYV